MPVSFTSHNIRLDDDSYTKPDAGYSMDLHPFARLGLPEFRTKRAFRDRENRRWASWNNKQSFWIQREYLLQAIREAAFDLVLEQFDALGSDIAFEMIDGKYRTSGRSTFIGIKTAYASEASAPAVSPGLRQA